MRYITTAHKMPHLYFGFEPRNRGTTKLAVKTPMGDLEPSEPSKVKVFVQATFSPVWSLLSGVLGLAVAILSFPKFSYVPTLSPGLMTRPATETIPLRLPGLAVVVKRGVSLAATSSARLEELGFSSMQFSGRTVWLKEIAEKEEFLEVDKMADVDPLGPSPARYLNTHSFRALLVLRSFTTRVCELFHYLSQTASTPSPSAQSKSSELLHGWENALNMLSDDDTPAGTSDTMEFKEKLAYKIDNGCDRTAASLITFVGGSTGISSMNSGVVGNPLASPLDGFFRPGSASLITTSGLIMKFHPRLALPDPNIIGDIIGRRFLSGLGETREEQFENLELLKTGLAGLRLTRLGDEMAHLYKCIDIAIDCNAGCVPVFTKSTYEGSVICGGPGATILLNGVSYPFLPSGTLADEFLSISDHVAAITHIASNFPAGKEREGVIATTSMVGLRILCLELKVEQEIKDEIIRRASSLDYGANDWVISPTNLKSCFSLISSLSKLREEHPVGRLALFSRDPVLVALSCFGEKTAPSWDIPNGTTCSLKKHNPPSPPASVTRERSQRKGDISDASWVMIIRQTDLFSSVEEFKRMASTLTYRSTASALARRVGHRVFSKERMAEFWLPMREALRVVNPLADFETGEGTLKRGATDAAEGILENKQAGKRRRMDF